MTYTPRPGSDTELLIKALQQRQQSIRIVELGEITGVDANTIQAKLMTAVQHGAVIACKVVSDGKSTIEYRIGSGLAMASQGNYNPKKQPITTRKPQPRLPPPAKEQPAQPEVAAAVKQTRPATSNTGSDREPPSHSQLAAVAVAAVPATPAPQAAPGMVQEKRKAPAGDDISINIDHCGTLTIANDKDVIELGPDQVKTLNRFLSRTITLWSPAQNG